jgi:competence protein ComFC
MSSLLWFRRLSFAPLNFRWLPFLAERLLQFLLPAQCPCCLIFLEEGQRGFCSRCLSHIRWIEPPFCSVCGTPFASPDTGIHLCNGCMKIEKHFRTARALGYYENTLRECIHSWKYEGKTQFTRYFGRWMADGVQRYWGLAAAFDVIIAVPLQRDRLRQRGFNQSILLAREISRVTRIPYWKRAFEKSRPTPPQVALSGADRERALRGVFRVTKGSGLTGKSVLLLDDVYTTGATVNECAKELMAAGAKTVDVLTLAHAIKNR